MVMRVGQIVKINPISTCPASRPSDYKRAFATVINIYDLPASPGRVDVQWDDDTVHVGVAASMFMAAD